MAVAAIKFTQGITTDLAGRALIGVAGVAVNVTNGNNTGVTSYRIEMLDVPYNSALPTGVLADVVGPTPFAPFTPDVPGTYQLKLRLNGDDVIIDVRDFIVPNLIGWLVPAKGSNDLTFNYAGQTRGWKTAVNTIFAAMATFAQPTFAPGVQTIVDLRAVAAINRVDKQVRLVEDVGALYRFDTGTGAGIPDDGNLVILPNDILLASPGRWYKLPSSVTAQFQDPVISVGYASPPNVPVPTVPEGIAAYRGDIAGVPRDSAALIWDEVNSYWRSAILNPNEVTITSDANLLAGSFFSSNLNSNRLVFVGPSGQLQTPTSVVIPNTQVFEIQSSVTVDTLALISDEIQWSVPNVIDTLGPGNPGGIINANKGSLFRSMDGALYVKFANNGSNTGWNQVVHTGAFFLGGNVAGLVGFNRVEGLSGDSVNFFVDMPSAFLRIGDLPGASAYADDGNIRVSNGNVFKISVREGNAVAGVNNTNLMTYSPTSGTYELGNGATVATSTGVYGGTSFIRATVGDAYVKSVLSSSLRTGAVESRQLEAFDDGAGRRVLAIQYEAAFVAADAPTGDRITYIRRAATEPTSSPVLGATMWCDTNGVLWFEYPNGNIHRSDNGGLVDINIAGADYTLVRSEWRQRVIRVATADANRNLILPVQNGRIWNLTNETNNRTITVKTLAQVGGVAMGANNQVVVAVFGGNVVIVKEQ